MWAPLDQETAEELASLNEAERDRFLGQKAIQWICQHPERFLRLAAKRAIRAFASDTASLSIYVTEMNRGRLMHIPQWILLLLYIAANAAYYLLVFVFLRRLLILVWNISRGWREIVVIALFLLAIGLPIMLIFGLSRYRDFFFYVALICAGGLMDALISGNRSSAT
jgi:hypothetical protein